MTLLTADVVEGFCEAVLRSTFDNPSPIPDFHRELWELCCSTEKRVAIAAPRSHGKSTAVTHTYGLATLLFRERRYLIIVSDTTTQAIQFLGDIKRELNDNEELVSLFGIKGFIKDTEDDVIVELTDGHTFRIQAKGAEQKLRGLKWANKRPDIIICDDAENDEAVLNRDRRDKLRRWFNGALLPCLSDGGIIRVVGTVLHLDSLLESLMPENQLKCGQSLKQKHLQDDELRQWSTYRTPWKSIKYRAHNPDFSKILWPERKTKQMFQDLRQTFISQGIADVYAQEMLNQPLDESNTFFKKADFLPIRDEDRKKPLKHYITCDLAVSKSNQADYTVFAIAGMDSDGRIQLVNLVRDRMSPDEIVSTMLSLHKTYKPELFGVEKGTIQKSIYPFLNDAMVKSNTYLNLHLMTPSTDKITRAQSIRARMRIGACKFDKQADWFQDFEDELMKFPRAKHDDSVDAWAYMGLMLDRMVEAPTQEEQEEIELQEEFSSALEDSYSDGRDEFTGY